VENSSVLEFGEFEEKVGILPFSSELGYPNEILHSMQKEINWINDYHKNVFKKLRKFINKSEMDEFRLLCSNL